MDEERDCTERIQTMTTEEGARKAIVGGRGGVAEVLYCPPGMKVEIRDYDDESEDEVVVSEYSGALPGDTDQPGSRVDDRNVVIVVQQDAVKVDSLPVDVTVEIQDYNRASCDGPFIEFVGGRSLCEPVDALAGPF